MYNLAIILILVVLSTVASLRADLILLNKPFGRPSLLYNLYTSGKYALLGLSFLLTCYYMIVAR